MSEGDKLSKAAKLALTGAIAPILRSASVTAQKRRIAKVDKDGNVTGYTTLAEVQEALVADKALEIQVDEGVRPKEIICEMCGKLVEVGPVGAVPSVCSWEDGGCHRQLFCPCGCGKVPGRLSFSRSSLAERDGGPWGCPRARARKRAASMTPEQRSEWARKVSASMTPEQRREAALKAGAASARSAKARTPEQRSEVARKRAASITPEQRSKAVRKGRASMTPEQRSEVVRKAWETRRAKAAQKATAAE